MSDNSIEKPCLKIEDTMNSVLSGDTLTNALSFAAFLSENDMAAGGEHGAVSYKSEVVCYMHIDGAEQMPGPWTIWPEGDYSSERENVLLGEGLKEIAWKNVNFCGDCGAGCSPGNRKAIFGKEFDNVCGAVMAFTDPCAETLECVKKLLEMRKLAISNPV